MNRPLLIALACAGTLTAPATFADSFPDRARVISAQPVVERIPVSREECWNDRVRGYENRRVTRTDTGAAIGPGTVLGAVVGGVVGHQFGHSSGGRDRGTAAGAIVGGLLGNQIDRDNSGPPERVEEVDRVPV
ncbi:MAG TPA: glycine zipper 2TM domain-containing protein, partial [Usitatibacter sp.]|nr:glycine zipper 2TM domain-containing protein [Usitatibacter sp.]